MKTTVEIPDSLLNEARAVATRHQTTVRALIIEGLRRSVAERRRAGGFRLRKATFKGHGLQSGIEAADWGRMRELAYEGRGG